MSSMRSSVLRKVATAAATATAASAFAIPATAAGAGPPQNGGGCHMVSSPSPNGLFHMMAGSANGQGAEKMGAMLSHFSKEPFCGF
jgi:hypothetical protein